MNVKSFFDRHVVARLSEAPALFSLGRVIAFDITGARGGQWTLELQANPTCHVGHKIPAQCTLAVSDDDFEQLLLDPSAPFVKTFFMQGRIRVLGSMGVAMHLPALLTILLASHNLSGIEALFNPLSLADFRQTYWPEKYCLIHGALDRIDELKQIAALQSVDSLLSAWPGSLRLADRFGGREVDTAQARVLYARGYHLAFSDAEQVFPTLKGILERLRWDLHLPISTFGRCPVYASPNGAGEALHFDQNANFIIQIKGEKIWHLAPNQHLTRPTDRYTTAQPQPSAELQIYGPAELPTTLPAEAETIHLRPGSVLFLPRGYWHQTRAVGDSLSLNFTFDQPTWADILSPNIRNRLLVHEAWRALATGAGHLDACAAQQAVAELKKLVLALPDDLKPIDVDLAIAQMTPTQAAQVLISYKGSKP